MTELSCFTSPPVSCWDGNPRVKMAWVNVPHQHGLRTFQKTCSTCAIWWASSVVLLLLYHISLPSKHTSPEACACLRTTSTQVKFLTAHNHPSMPSRSKLILPAAEERYRKCLSARNSVPHPITDTHHEVPPWYQYQGVVCAQASLNQLLLSGDKLPGLIVQNNQARPDLA